MKHHKHGAAGVALIIVLGFLVIISALAVAFFTSVTTELKASRNFASGVTTRQLADSAVQLVMGQIADATTRGINPTSGVGTEAWASQPGMLRVFDANGNPDAFYLLYSSDNMLITGGAAVGYDPALDLHSNGAAWDTAPAVWTDLNEPVMAWDYVWNGTGYTPMEVPRFPIIDPRAYSDPSLSTTPGTPLSSTTIYNSEWANNKVEGFWYDTTNLTGYQVDGIVGPGGGSGANGQRLPMPVKWIYVLQDGTLTTPNAQTSTATMADFSGYSATDVRRPTATNPIVGRMAFWTDDETSKLNLNTAAGFINTPGEVPAGYDATTYAGSFWDTPRFYTWFDRGMLPQDSTSVGVPVTSLGTTGGGGGLALCQLLQFEFQRYPGHPATTSLSPVLTNLITSMYGSGTNAGESAQTSSNFTSTQLYGLCPRYSATDMTNQPGSTFGGTVRQIVDNSGAGGPTSSTGVTGLASMDDKQLQPKQDRLYNSPDELLFGAHAGGMNNGNINQTTGGYERIVNDYYVQPPLNGANGPYTPTVLTPQTIDSLRFFLTTQSRSPDLNLYGQPRISAWPVRAETSVETSGLNVYDNLILFCSTIGASTLGSSRPDTSDSNTGGSTEAVSNGQFRYIFTRREIDTTGSAVTVGGTTGSPTLSATQDCERPRNMYLIGNYLYNFLSGGAQGQYATVPGFGGSWKNKYTSYDQASVLLEMFDYIRCANSQDTTIPAYQATLGANAKSIMFAPQGMILPSVPDGSFQPQTPFAGCKGTGRMSTLCEATMVFYYGGPKMCSGAGVLDVTSTDWVEAQNTNNPVNVTGGTNGKGKTDNANTGWSRWDPLNQAARYAKEYAVNPANQSQPAPDLTKATQYVTQGYMRAFLVFSTFDPMQGYGPKFDPVNANSTSRPLATPASPKMVIQATWEADPTITFVGSDPFSSVPNGTMNIAQPMHWANVQGSTNFATTINRAPGSYWGGRNFGGYEGFMHTLMGPGSTSLSGKEKIAWGPNSAGTMTYLANNSTIPDAGLCQNQTAAGVWSSTNNAMCTYTASNAPLKEEFYPFQTLPASPILVPVGLQQFTFNGGNLDVSLYYGGNSSQNKLQSFRLVFPPASGWPVPMGGVAMASAGMHALPFLGRLDANGAGKPVPGSADVTTWNATTDGDSLGGTGAVHPASGISVISQGYSGLSTWYWGGRGAFFQPNAVTWKTTYSNYAYHTSLQAAWSFPTRLAWCMGTGMYNGGVNVTDNGNSTGVDENGDSWDPATQPTGAVIEYSGDRWHSLVQPGDTIRSLLYWDGNGATGPGSLSTLAGIEPTASGDMRICQLQTTVLYNATSAASGSFAPHPDYFKTWSRASNLRGGDGTPYFPITSSSWSYNTTTPEPSPANVLAVSNGTAQGTGPEGENAFGNHVYLGTSNKARMQPGMAMGNLPWGGGTLGAASIHAVNGILRSFQVNGTYSPGDFDNGLGDFPDGPFCNKQDEGNVIYRYWDAFNQKWVYPIPYFTSTWSYQVPGDSFTSPARQMPSPVMFGSLPAHVIGNGTPGSPAPHQWETLCFCPNPAGFNHPGLTFPKDHLLLDLFSNPVVEPYPISEPFSTAGRVNLNYRIAPFDYIRRSTALRGALSSVRVTAVPSQYKTACSETSASTWNFGTPVSGDPNWYTYKTGTTALTGYGATTPLNTNFRHLVDRNQTITEMDAVYNSLPGNGQQGFFVSASQICEMFLIPWSDSAPTMSASPGASNSNPTSLGTNMQSMKNWWASPWDLSSATGNGDLTGDNEREKPYADLYPRVTTKSNTYTVHMKVQTLRQLPKAPGAAPTDGTWAQWNEGKDQVLGEYRGSSTIERYIDPADPRIAMPGGAVNGAPTIDPDIQSVEPLYRFRTVISKKFSP